MSAHAPDESELGQYIPQASFLDRLVDRLELAANTRSVFGEPVERYGATIVPVAKARFAMGGGWGTRHTASDDPGRAGTGGGGAARVTPIGYIELANGHTTFRTIRDPAAMAWMVVAGSLFGLTTMRSIGRIAVARRAKRRLKFAGLRRLFR